MPAPFDRKNATCVNHPQQRASRRCYRCLAPICKPCQQRFMGHIFCGKRCQNLFWAGEKLAWVRGVALRGSLRLRRVGRTLDHASGGRGSGILTGAFLLLLLYQAFTLHQASREISLLRQAAAPPAASVPGRESAGKPSSSPASIDLSLARQGKETTLSGAAPGFAVATLVVDGVQTQSVPVRDGGFLFRLGSREQEGRSAQVSVFGDGIPAIYSRALPLRPPPAERPREKPATSPEAASPPSPGPAALLPTAPPSRPSAPVVPLPPPADFARGPEAGRMIALTFDGGSSDSTALPILDILREKGVKGTFFLTGEFIRRYPDVTRRIVADGHEVGNHGFGHHHLTTFERNLRHDTVPGMTREILQKDLEDNAQLFRTITGQEMVRLWRAPYGEHNETLRRWGWEVGWRHIGWTYDPRTRLSLDTLDWVSNPDSRLYLTSEQMVRKIFDFEEKTGLGLSGGIVLLHLGNERQTDPLFPLARLIDELKRKGYNPSTVSDLLGGTAVAARTNLAP